MNEPTELRHPGHGWWTQAGTLTQVAVFLVIVTASWFMLKELAVLLRPLLLATLLCYIILPLHSRIHQGYSGAKTIAIMVIGTISIVTALGLIVYGGLISLSEELPRLAHRAQEFAVQSQEWSHVNLPPWVSRHVDDLLRAESKGAQSAENIGGVVLAYAANILLETVVVGLYVVFLLLEARRLRYRVQSGFDSGQSKSILYTIRTINDGIANYLKAKVKTSAILATPVTVILLLSGVKFSAIWGLLTFLANFIPYVGTIIGLGSPLIFTFLDLPFGWLPFVVALLLIACHATSASFVEPQMIGRAVGLSPLIVLICLTFWGLCWGIVGMLLAVPLTVTIKIILANIETTKPLAVLLGDD